jgi:hypothetical protein
VRAGTAADGRTFFVYGIGGPLAVGLEAIDGGGYLVRNVSDCTGDVTSLRDPAGYPGPNDRWRVVHAVTQAGMGRLHLTWELP